MTTSRSPAASGAPLLIPAQHEGRLPRPLTPLVGRDADLASLGAMLATDGVQIVTILGPGGIGKTRLAIEAARRTQDRYPDGARFVELAPVRDPSLVPAVIGRALGVSELQGHALLDRVEAVAGTRCLLLIVDNLEHLIASAPLLTRIAERCPLVTILCTSRSRLGIAGEHVFRIPPLELDAAVTLFTERAEATSPGFANADVPAGVVREVCARLDGLPLAIELAAARVPVLSPRELLQGLDDRFSVLAHGLQDMPDRHHDLRTAVGWSYDLLDPGDQAVFRRLAVFSGGFTLDAAAAIAPVGSPVLDLLGRLEASSLVHRMPGPGEEARFTLLETIREFALERLSAAGELQDAQRAHARHLVKICHGTDRLWWEPAGKERLDLVERELPNVRVALEWLREAADFDAYLDLAGALGPLWASRGYSVEGRICLEWGLAHSNGVARDAVIAALWSLSWILNQHEDNYRALLTAQEGYRLALEQDEAIRIVPCLIASGVGAFRFGLVERAMVFQKQALCMLDACPGEAWTQVTTCIVMNQLGFLAIHRGQIDEAEQWYSRTEMFQHEHGLQFSHGGHATMGLGDVARARGRPAAALPFYQAALRVIRHALDVRSRAYVVAAIAGSLAALGQFALAARLFGAAEAEHERIAFPFVSHTFDRQRAMGLPEPWAQAGRGHGIAEKLYRALRAQTAHLRALSLDPEQCQAWWQEGRLLPFEVAMDLALEVMPATVPEAGFPGGLSPREVDVLRLLARGHSDLEIARLLSISQRTASNHVHHIYTKLDLGSRAAATGWAIRQGLA